MTKPIIDPATLAKIQDLVTPELEKKAKKILLKKQVSLLDLSDALDCSPKMAKRVVEKLREQNVNVQTLQGELVIAKEMHPVQNKLVVDTDDFISKGNWRTFGVLGDTHLANRNARLDVLNSLYDIYEEEGITHVFHTGNAVDGECRFNRHELVTRAGIDAQMEYFANEYPQREGIKTQFITGEDHEGWWVAREGINIGQVMQDAATQKGRKDLEWIGHVERDVEFRSKKGTAWARVMHPGGGSSYAISYTEQKIVEMLQGGEKPHILFIGHYHKFGQGYPREVHTVQTGCTCFLPATRVETECGRIPIAKVTVGDRVLTHKGAWKPVTKVMSRVFSGRFFTLWTGRSAHAISKGMVTATEDHPFLTLENGKPIWKAIKEIKRGDWVAVRGHYSPGGQLIPWYRGIANSEIYKTKPNRLPKQRDVRHTAGVEGFVPAEGEKFIPLTRVLPDGIVINWAKRTVVAFELERNRSCPHNPRKYDLLPPGTYNDVLWMCTGRSGKSPRREYRVVDGNVFVQVKRIESKRYRSPMKVFNLEVADDHSYIAGQHVVHNCDQTAFLRRMKIQVHVGGTIVRFHQADTGEINRFQVEWLPYYDRGFYNKYDKYRRW